MAPHSSLYDYNEGTRLLEHPHFLLLYVPPDNNGTKMKLIKPANDSYHRERIWDKMASRGTTLLPYYALSHLWGITKTHQHLWNNIGDYVDDEKGQPAAPVCMRPEKRNTLLKLLAHHPDSYWWIDVLCARTDTPLDIMGDIYALCTECIALIDCDPDIIPQLHSSMNQLRDKSRAKDDRQSAPLENAYKMRGTLAQGRWWRRWQRWCYQKRYNYKTRQQSKLFWKASGMLDTLGQCHWWKRVWTWQEMVLPVTVKLISERTLHLSTDHILDIDDLKRFPGKLDYNARHLGIYDDWYHHPDVVCFEIWISRKLKAYFAGSESEIVAVHSLLVAFSRSVRRCMDPVDYVYGVLGVLKMYIPRKTDPDEVWQLFLEKLSSSKMPISDHAKRFNLATATNMADIYKDLLK